MTVSVVENISWLCSYYGDASIVVVIKKGWPRRRESLSSLVTDLPFSQYFHSLARSFASLT